MNRDERAWNRLQGRWAAGETLTDAEERDRLGFAAQSPLAARELEIFSELRNKLQQTPPPLEPPYLERILPQLGLKTVPRLRLVAKEDLVLESEPNPEKPKARRRFLAATAFAAALAAGMGAFFFSTSDFSSMGQDTPPTPAESVASARSELVFTSGHVTLGDELAVIGEGTLREGQRLSTTSGQACLTIDPKIDVCLDSESAARIESLRMDDVRIRVERGTVIAALGPRAAHHSFSLVAADFRARAQGTIFALEHGPESEPNRSSESRVLVLEGKVLVIQPGAEPALVTEHSYVRLNRSQISGPVQMGRGEEAPFATLIARRELWQRPELGMLRIDLGSVPTRALVGALPPMALPLRTFLPVGKHRITLRDDANADTSLEVEILPGKIQSIEPPARVRKRAVQRGLPPAAPSVESAAQLLTEARRELAAGSSDRALSLYRRLRAAHPESPEAATVLVTLGKLELDRGAPGPALAAFESYLRTGGPLAQEALAGKIKALRALGRTAEERTAIQQYLLRHPNGFDAPSLRRRLEAP